MTLAPEHLNLCSGCGHSEWVHLINTDGGRCPVMNCGCASFKGEPTVATFAKPKTTKVIVPAKTPQIAALPGSTPLGLPAKKTRDNSKFKGGMRGAVYKCDCCGRQTRDTGIGEHVGICAFCYEAAGIDNALSDHSVDGPTAIAQYEDLVKQYGKRAHEGCLSFSFKVEAPKIPLGAVIDNRTLKNDTKTTHPGFTGCTGLTKAGNACTMPPIKGTDKCFNHRKG